MEPDAPSPMHTENSAISVDQYDTKKHSSHSIHPSTPASERSITREGTQAEPDLAFADASTAGSYAHLLSTNTIPLPIATPETQKHQLKQRLPDISGIVTYLLPIYQAPIKHPPQKQETKIGRKKALSLIILLCIIVFQTLSLSTAQISGTHGWNYLLYGNSIDSGNSSTLQALTHPTSGSHSKTASRMTPQQYITKIIQNMSLDQKIGQMMMVQFVGPVYSTDLDTMIKQDHVGAVLLFTANGNIVDKNQLTTLTQQIQAASTLPMGISTDQEGGAVDRLVNLDGAEPSEATVGQSNNTTTAKNLGIQVANDLTSYGININLAPVVDIDTNPESELHLDGRTYGSTPDVVTKMAGAYLQGLQQSHKVIGTLKHFPGLGGVTIDPHVGLPTLSRSQSDLERIDWAPYTQLIKNGQVHAIMVTHEIIPSIDPNTPASLSPKLITNVLRDEMGFQGVVMTDSLTMNSIEQYYTPAQAAVAAVNAGSDIVMGANSSDDVETMMNGIKQAIMDNTISQTRIDQSIQRILLMKYQMGLLPIPTN